MVRKIVETGHRGRKEKQLKVRQPLAKATIKISNKINLDSYLTLIKGELNVKKVEINKSDNEEIEVEYDTRLTQELIIEGKLRDLIRQIQELRKIYGKKATDQINLIIPKEFQSFTEQIKKKVVAKKILLGEKLEISN